MQRIITDRIYFTSLDSRFNPCSQQKAMYQLEMYRSDIEDICAITSYTGKYSYSIGQKVDVAPSIELKENFSLTNIVKNAFFNAHKNNRSL